MVLNYMKIKFGFLVLSLMFINMKVYAVFGDEETNGSYSENYDQGGNGYDEGSIQSNRSSSKRMSNQQLSRGDYQGRYADDYNRNRQSFDDNRSRSRDKFESKHGAALDNQENQIASPQKFRLEQDKISEYKGRIKTLKDKMTNGNPTVEEMKLLIQFAEKLGKVYIARAIRLMKDKVKLDTYIETAKEAVKESTNLITTSGTMLKNAEKARKTRASTFQKEDNKKRKTDFDKKERDAIAKIDKSRTSDSIFKSFDKALGTASKTAAQSSSSSPY